MNTINKPLVSNVAELIASQQAAKLAIRTAARMVNVRKPRDPSRLTKAQAKSVRDLVLRELHACYRSIQDKCREYPAWAPAYNSAMSAVEARIEAFANKRPCTCPANAGCTEPCDRNA